MKPHKLFIPIIIGFLLMSSAMAMAFDPASDCVIKINDKKLKEWKLSSLQVLFDDYTNLKYSNYKDEQYILCFNEPSPGFEPKTTLNIDTSKAQKPILIYNFIASAENLTTSILLQLTGSNITITGSTFQGSGSGTALKIDAKDVTIDTAAISKFATAIETTSNSEKATIKGATISDGGIILAGIGHKIESSTLTGADSGVGIKGNGSNLTIDAVNISKFATPIELAGSGGIVKNSTLTTTGTGPVIKISENYGAFVLKDTTITGAGLGAALEIPAGVQATIGPTVTIDNFEKGIFIKSGGSAKITQDSIFVKSFLITDAIVFETPISNSAFNEKLIGKHLSEADTNFADKFIGQLAGKTADSCVGNVEVMYKKDGNWPFNYLATCPLKWIKDEADKVTLKNKDDATSEIGANSCIFECKDLTTVAINYLVTFVYTDGNGVTNDYLPSTPLVSDLADVINIQIGGIVMGPTTSGITTETTEPTDPIAPPLEPANFDPSNPKGQTNDTNNSDGDGGQVGAGTGCSLIR